MFQEEPVLTGIPAFPLENPKGLCYVRQTRQNHEGKGLYRSGAPVRRGRNEWGRLHP
jgi:hypothetical protein